IRIIEWSSDVCSSDLIPGVQLLNTGNTGNSLNIRGIGSGSENPAFEQSVATFVDDTYIGRGKMLSSTFMDLERIEVLKGPQTTYFGNNAISGALNIITKIPDFEFGGRARVLYGRSEEHTSELQSLMRISYAVFCLKKKKQKQHIK